MTEYRKSTDTAHQVQLASKLVHAIWVSRAVCAGEKAPFEVWTQFVGNGADIQVTAQDDKGKTLGKVKGQLFGNYFADVIDLPTKAGESMTFTAKLPKHSLQKKSGVCQILPPVRITNQKWGEKEVRRGDRVSLSADVENVVDGREVLIFIYEHDRDGAHDFITRFPCKVENGRIEAEWSYAYHDDTDEIPTDPEMKKSGKGYSAPTYFWVAEYGRKTVRRQTGVGVAGVQGLARSRSGRQHRRPVADEKYEVEFADGSKKSGRLDKNGQAQIKDVPPGKADIRYPDPLPGLGIRKPCAIKVTRINRSRISSIYLRKDRNHLKNRARWCRVCCRKSRW